MDIVVYEGALPEDARLEELTRQACARYGAMELALHRCQNEEQLGQMLEQLAAKEALNVERYYPFRSTAGTYLLRLSQVYCFRSNSHRLIVQLEDGTEITGRSMRISARDLLAPLIADGRFVRTTKSVYVNVRRVRSFTPDAVHMDNDAVLPISRRYYAGLARLSPALSLD